MLYVIFQTELEQNSDVAAYASLFFAEAENKLYDEKKVNFCLKLMMSFQNQNSFSTIAYDIIAKY